MASLSVRVVGRNRSLLVGNTAWMLLGYAGRIGLQGVAFVLLARGLGPSGYGLYAGTLATVMLLSPFVEFGTYGLVVQDITTGTPASLSVGTSIIIAAMSLPPAFAILVVAKALLLGAVPWIVVATTAFAVFVGARLISTARAVCVGHEMMWRNACIELVNGASQLIAVGALLWMHGDVKTWGWLYLLVNLVVGALAIASVLWTWGWPQWSLAEVRSRVRPGFHFAVGLAAQNAYTDIDKAMLVRFSSASDAGIFGVAQRFVSVAMLPLMAFEGALYPRFFGAGRNGYAAARDLAKRVTPATLAYGAVIGVATWVAAPWIVSILGDGFAESVAALRLLTLLMVIQALTYPFADALTGSRQQATRSTGQLIALGLSFLLNLYLIPRSGWRGAAVASIAVQFALLGFVIAYPLCRPSLGATTVATKSERNPALS